MWSPRTFCLSLFFFNDTATTEIYTLSLHDALPILPICLGRHCFGGGGARLPAFRRGDAVARDRRSEEHTSELQSPCNLVCRLLLEKKKEHRTRACASGPRQSRRLRTPPAVRLHP